MGHPRSALWLGLIALTAPGAAAQEDAPGPLRLSVVSVERVEKGFRITLRGETDAKGGSVFSLRVSSRACRLAEDGRSLELAASSTDAVSCRVEVQGGAFTAILNVSRPVPHEACLTPEPASSEKPPRTGVVTLFDPDWVEREHRKDLKLFAERVRKVQEFVAALKPHDGSNELLPEELTKRFHALQRDLLPWLRETHLQASGSALMEVLKEIVRTIPRKNVSPNAGRTDMPAAYPELSRERRVGVGVLDQKLRRVEEVAVRESLLLFLAPLEDLLSAGLLKEARRAAKALRDIPFEAGELTEVCRAYAPAQGLAAVVSDVPDDPGSLKTLQERLGKFRDQIARPE